MADFYFFTDPDKLVNQNVNEAFGPAGSTSGKDLYRITCLHSSLSSSNAYAICDGTICVQQDVNNSNIVNIILRPNQQPDINLPYLSFIIYKGILKSSLFDGAGNVLNDLTNDLTKSIKTSWDAYKAIKTDSAALAPEKALGIHLIDSITNFADSDPINNLFYQNQSEYQFPNVKGGWKIGSFDPAKFGIEIITEKIGFEPTLKLTRQLENYIEVESLLPEATNSETFKHWHDKEDILNFIDPCAFFGSFYASKLKTKSLGGTFDIKQNDEIYDVFLKGIQHTNISNGNFFNRNFVYLDIRNEHNQSFNYYQNYGNDIRLLLTSNFDDTLCQTINYYNSGWPILILNSANNLLFEVNNTGSKNSLWINLPEGDNQNPIAYISQGYLNKSNPFKKQPKDKKKFKVLTVPDNFTSELELATPNKSGAVSTTPISCLIKVRYFNRINEKTVNPPPNSGLAIQSSSFLDSIFRIFDMKLLDVNNTTSKLKVRIFHDEVYINSLDANGIDFVANLGVAESTDKIVFFVFAKDLNETSGLYREKRKINFVSQSTESFDELYNLINFETKSQSLIGTNLLPDVQTGQIQVVQLESENLLSSKKFIYPNYEDEFHSVVIDKQNYLTMKSEATSPTAGNLLGDYCIFLGLDNAYISSENAQASVDYNSYDLVLKGFTQNASSVLLVKEFALMDNSAGTTNSIYKIYN